MRIRLHKCLEVGQPHIHGAGFVLLEVQTSRVQFVRSLLWLRFTEKNIRDLQTVDIVDQKGLEQRKEFSSFCSPLIKKLSEDYGKK
jgi:hypothetical protein